MTLPTWRRSNSVCVSTRTLPTTNPAPSTGSLIGQNWRSFYNASKPSVRHKTKCPRASWHKTRWRHWLPNSTVNCGHGPLSERIAPPARLQNRACDFRRTRLLNVFCFDMQHGTGDLMVTVSVEQLEVGLLVVPVVTIRMVHL